jgi:hypothetical protein
MKENLYHFTAIAALENILENGILFKKNDLYSKDFKYYYTISTTRKFNFNFTYDDININNVRIVLDKEKIKNDYKIIPTHWYNTEFKNDNAKPNGTNDQRTVAFVGRDSLIYNQFEERICMNPNDVYKRYFLLPKYIKQINVLESYKDKMEQFKNPYNIKIQYYRTFKDLRPIKEMKHIKTYIQIFENNKYDDFILPKGSILYHGTVEDIKGELNVGGYDKVLWTAKDKLISKMYIPDSSTTIYTSTRLIAKPDMGGDNAHNNFLKDIGLIYYDVKFQNNRPSSYGLKYVGDASYLNDISNQYDTNWNIYYKLDIEFRKLLDEYKKLGDDDNISDNELEIKYKKLSDVEKEKEKISEQIPNVENEILKYINKKLEELGYKNNSNSIDKDWKLKEYKNKIQRADYRSEGSLYQLTAKQDIKFYDMTKDSEGDLTDLQYHKLGSFRKAEENGYNGVKIHDFAQSDVYGNYGHISYGIFKNSINLFDVKFIEKAYHPNENELK